MGSVSWLLLLGEARPVRVLVPEENIRPERVLVPAVGDVPSHLVPYYCWDWQPHSDVVVVSYILDCSVPPALCTGILLRTAFFHVVFFCLLRGSNFLGCLLCYSIFLSCFLGGSYCLLDGSFLSCPLGGDSFLSCLPVLRPVILHLVHHLAPSPRLHGVLHSAAEGVHR